MVVLNFRRFFFILAISILALSVKAQQQHFVYLQTENGQPFYVKLNNKLISSSPTGYIILPGIDDGDYQLVVGFPKNEFPEESFNVSVDKKNEGFLLKNFGEKGWGLFNMQSLALVNGNISNSAVVVTTPTTTKTQNDPFSNMLASVVKDSSLLQKNEPVIETPVVKSPETIPTTAITPQIKKILNEKDKDGIQMVYLDKNEINNDTIRIFIPQNHKTENKNASDENKTLNPPSGIDTSQLTITPTIVAPDPDTVTIVNDTIRIYKEPALKTTSDQHHDSEVIEKKKGNPMVTLIEPAPIVKTGKKVSSEKKEEEIIVLPKALTSSTVNSDCKGFANDADFLKLRKKMAAETSNDAMVQAAKKIFRTKCFSTEQIKNLSYLFLTDEGKYMFLDAAYPFTSDSDQYSSLVSQLTDEYYVKRFNAMIHK
jgi:hypothetical protein